jgi:hypothetical protein
MASEPHRPLHHHVHTDKAPPRLHDSVSFWVMSPAYACSLGVVHAMIRKPLIPY